MRHLLENFPEVQLALQVLLTVGGVVIMKLVKFDFANHDPMLRKRLRSTKRCLFL